MHLLTCTVGKQCWFSIYIEHTLIRISNFDMVRVSLLVKLLITGSSCLPRRVPKCPKGKRSFFFKRVKKLWPQRSETSIASLYRPFKGCHQLTSQLDHSPIVPIFQHKQKRNVPTAPALTHCCQQPAPLGSAVRQIFLESKESTPDRKPATKETRETNQEGGSPTTWGRCHWSGDALI